MSTVTPTPTPGEALPPYRFTVDQYHEIVRAGILSADDRVELLEGLLVTKMTKNQPHIVATDLVQAALTTLLPSGWFVSMQNPITITPADSEPEPDALVIRGSPRGYRDRRVVPQDLALVVEVADTSVGTDQSTKKRIYARAGIPIYWIVNLTTNRIEVYSNPSGPAGTPDYRLRRDYGPGESLPLIVEGREVGHVAVNDLLP